MNRRARILFRFLFAAAVLLVPLSAVRYLASPMVEGPAEDSLPTAILGGDYIGPEIPKEFRIERHEDIIPSRSTLQEVLFGFDFTPGQVHQLIQETREVYNLNRLVAGNRFAVERFGSGQFKSLEYHIDDEKFVQIDHIDGRFFATEHVRQLETRVEEMHGRISDSLWNTIISKGETGRLVMELAELLQWDVAFTSIQPNDSFKLIFEKRYDDRQFVKYGDIRAVEFTNQGKSFYAFLFADPETGEKRYYARDGTAVRKAFLRVPFKADWRISSGFSHSRLHPVTGVRRPHLAVDYAAPHGTPVLASGSGRVVFAGYRGANGNLVKIRHPNGYTTWYLHLSRIHVKLGQHVSQGHVIGRVGATGVATGPHLDYRIQDDRGRFINPQRQLALPSDKPVDPSRMPEFEAVRDKFLEQLEGLPEDREDSSRISVAG